MGSIASEYASELVIGGAVVGFLVGFGFPKVIKRLLQIGIPVVLVAMQVKKTREGEGA